MVSVGFGFGGREPKNEMREYAFKVKLQVP